MKKLSSALVALFLISSFIIFTAGASFATAISITNRTGALDYILGTSEGVPFNLNRNNNNDQILYLWDEVQNYTLAQDLYVDRVADPTASYVGGTTGNYHIMAGTIVSSHYVQWDPRRSNRVEATLNFDSDIFALITRDRRLFDSDFLGLSDVNYGNFRRRGLERRDTAIFNGGSVDINWRASNPGDWTRLITAYSPGSGPAPVPEPATIFLLGTGLIGIVGIGRKKFINM